jgi:hypothetical protein
VVFGYYELKMLVEDQEREREREREGYTYGMAATKWLDVEEGEGFVALEELHGGDFT